ncbi:MAG TPA: SDR family oxidoreductase [Solirubrobacteraceae bacterium]|nr:SDR family oxidoreductase [Solirubrobacteraceae bacterium]
MELSEKVAVVTGGASGIGRALAWRFADEGAKVVVADLRGAEEAAAEIGALGVGCDVSDERQVVELIDRVEREVGAVDLFAANAGVGGGMGLDGFESALAVNVMQHVHAARRLVPGWLERGGGYFLSTASAAGLLTQIGSASYSVSKHGAVAFAEWLAVTYGDQGIRVSVLCPMGVNTPLLHSGEEGAQAAAVVGAAGAIIEPEQVADDVVAALREERFLILPHPEVLTFFQRKASDYDRWLAGMRRLQAGIVASFEAGGR